MLGRNNLTKAAGGTSKSYRKKNSLYFKGENGTFLNRWTFFVLCNYNEANIYKRILSLQRVLDLQLSFNNCLKLQWTQKISSRLWLPLQSCDHILGGCQLACIYDQLQHPLDKLDYNYVICLTTMVTCLMTL